jgi:predicted acylesterase/phospholipase RssA
MRPVLFRSPDLDWEHVAASCAVPFFLRPYRIGNRYICDGGIVDPLPLWAAIEMGARRVIAIHLLKHRPWLVRQAVRALQLYASYHPYTADGLQIVEICPDARMGTAAQSMYWSVENAQRWIDGGRQDAMRSRDRVVECFQRSSDSATKGMIACPPTAFTV